MPKTDLEVQLTGRDGNVFNIIGTVYNAIRKVDRTLAEEYKKEATSQQSYDEVLQLTMEYVEVT